MLQNLHIPSIKLKLIIHILLKIKLKAVVGRLIVWLQGMNVYLYFV